MSEAAAGWVELERRGDIGAESIAEEGPESSLLPADSGKDAWLFLAASFLIEALVWGLPLSFGVLQEYYSTHEPFMGSENIATVGTTASVSFDALFDFSRTSDVQAKGLMYMAIPIWLIAILRFPWLQQPSPYVGLAILCVGLVGASFAKNTMQLIATQGFLYAIGGTTVYVPIFLFLDEWFVKRKGLAFGTMLAGVGAAGVVIPLIMSAALKAYGFRIALRGWTVVVFVLTAPALSFIKPRLPPSRTRRFDLSFLVSPDFIILELGNVIQGFGYFIPSIYLPTYARYIGASPLAATSTLVAFNIAAVIGCICVGSLVDRFHVTTATTLGAAGTTVAVLIFWGLAKSLPILFVFSVAYGLFAGGSSSTWPGIMKLISSKTARAEPALVFGFLSAGRGIGNIICGPVSEALLGGKPWQAAFGYGSPYGPLIVFTGVTACLSGLTIFARTRPGLL